MQRNLYTQPPTWPVSTLIATAVTIQDLNFIENISTALQLTSAPLSEMPQETTKNITELGKKIRPSQWTTPTHISRLIKQFETSSANDFTSSAPDVELIQKPKTELQFFVPNPRKNNLEQLPGAQTINKSQTLKMKQKSYEGKTPKPESKLHSDGPQLSIKCARRSPANTMNREESERTKDRESKKGKGIKQSAVTFSPLRIDISLPSFCSEDLSDCEEEKQIIYEIQNDIKVLIRKIQASHCGEEESRQKAGKIKQSSKHGRQPVK